MTTDRYEGHPALATRALLACGIVAGPVYVAATVVQALTRDGFDITHNRFTSLTTGELGWIHQANMVLAGALTMLFAAGASQVWRTGRGAVVGPWLIALFGATYAFGGALTADPVAGFPPGATEGMAVTTLEGAIQNASRSVSTFFLIAMSLVVAARFVGEGRRGLAVLAATSVPIIFAAIVAAGLGIGINTAGFAYLFTPWIWVSALALHLYRHEAN
jgi:hypothetical membrane protein